MINPSKSRCWRSSTSTNLKLRCTMCITQYNATLMNHSHHIYQSHYSTWLDTYGMLYSKIYHMASVKCILCLKDSRDWYLSEVNKILLWWKIVTLILCVFGNLYSKINYIQQLLVWPFNLWFCHMSLLSKIWVNFMGMCPYG